MSRGYRGLWQNMTRARAPRFYRGSIWHAGDSVAFCYKQACNMRPQARGIVRSLNKSTGLVTIDSPDHGRVRVHASCVSVIREGVHE